MFWLTKEWLTVTQPAIKKICGASLTVLVQEGRFGSRKRLVIEHVEFRVNGESVRTTFHYTPSLLNYGEALLAEMKSKLHALLRCESNRESFSICDQTITINEFSTNASESFIWQLGDTYPIYLTRAELRQILDIVKLV